MSHSPKVASSSQPKMVAIDWAKNLTGKEKEEFEQMVATSLPLRRLKELLSEKLTELDGQETKSTDYDNPSWAYRQADRNGFRRGLKYIDHLLLHLRTS